MAGNSSLAKAKDARQDEFYTRLTGKERCLSIRAFDERMKRAAYERQGGVCPYCGQHFEFSEMHADHIRPWSKGGTTAADNCQMLCRDCNLRKSDD